MTDKTCLIQVKVILCSFLPGVAAEAPPALTAEEDPFAVEGEAFTELVADAGFL